MALIPRWFKNKPALIFFGCFVFIAPLLIFHRPIYAAIYRWKEPHFIMPLYLKKDVLLFRKDRYGDGHFGAKRKGGRRHRGIDIKADMGTVVYAGKSGRAFCYYEVKGMGKYVKILHPDGFSSIYGHLKDWAIKSKSFVRQGQVIGFVGKSGNADVSSMQVHLHFEIRNENNKAVNPLEGYVKR